LIRGEIGKKNMTIIGRPNAKIESSCPTDLKFMTILGLTKKYQRLDMVIVVTEERSHERGGKETEGQNSLLGGWDTAFHVSHPRLRS